MMAVTEVTVNISVCANRNNASYVTIHITSLLKGANRPPLFDTLRVFIIFRFLIKVKLFAKMGVDIGAGMYYNVNRKSESADERLLPLITL